MPYTPRMGWLYSTEFEKDWYNTMVARLNQQDADVYSAIEDPNLVLTGGGNITLDSGADELTWSADFELLNMITGGKVTITADTLTGFEDGKIAYVQVARPVSGSQVGTLAVADTLAGDRSKIFIALRVGSNVLLRNNVNREGFMTFDYRGASKVTTSVATATGGTATGSIDLGIDVGNMWHLKVTALGNTTDSDIEFFSDAGMTNQLYLASNKDCYTAPYEDGIQWFIGDLVDGLIYYRMTNNGLNDSAYEIEPIGFGRMTG